MGTRRYFGNRSDTLAEAERQLAQVIVPVVCVLLLGTLAYECAHYLRQPTTPMLWVLGVQLVVAAACFSRLRRPVENASRLTLAAYVYLASMLMLTLWLNQRFGNLVHMGILSVVAFYLLTDRRFLIASQVYGFSLILITVGFYRHDTHWVDDFLIAALAWSAGLALHLGRVRLLETVFDSRQALEAEVSERRKAQAVTQIAQRREHLGAMVGGVAHDFNNLLTGILGGVQLLRKPSQDEAGRQKALALVVEASKAAQELCEQLLSYAKGRPIELRPVDVNEVVAQAVRHVRVSLPDDLTLHDSVQAVDAAVIGDGSQVRLAVINLIGNAVDAARSVVTVNTSVRHVGERQFAVVGVQDDGVGITPDVQDQMFDPFFTTKLEGKGLGLAVVAAAASMHGGDVSVSSSDAGTCIELLLPLAQHAHAESATAAAHVPRVRPAVSLSLLLIGVLDQLPYLIIHKDTNNRTLRVNRAFAQMRGLSREAMSDTPTEKWHPDEASQYYQDDLEVIESARPKFNIRELIEVRPGEKIWFITDKHPTFDAQGNVDGVLVISKQEAKV